MNATIFRSIVIGIVSVCAVGAVLVWVVDKDTETQRFSTHPENSATSSTEGNDDPDGLPSEHNDDGNGEEDPDDTPAGAVMPKPEVVWGDRTKKEVIFTFDGGSGAQSADAILATLKKHNVRGAFFLTGKWAETNSALVRQMAHEGHEIYNHTYTHRDLTTLSSAEIKEEFRKTETIIKGITGISTKPYFRPPYGARNAGVLQAAADAGYRSIYWTVDALDWKEDEGFTDAQTKERIYSNLKPGTIYMMHIGDNITGRVLDEVLAKIQADGYAIVPLSESIE